MLGHTLSLAQAACSDGDDFMEGFLFALGTHHHAMHYVVCISLL